jgi:hypothetical protein
MLSPSGVLTGHDARHETIDIAAEVYLNDPQFDDFHLSMKSAMNSIVDNADDSADAATPSIDGT